MHKVINFGSALQACALLKKVRDMGYEAELIDYKYPTAIHKVGQNKFQEAIKQMIHFVLSAIVGFPTIRQVNRYKAFWKEQFVLSSKRFRNEIDIQLNPPLYDVYMTGSDQVWNSLFTKKDGSFLLSFAPEGAKKVSYASSMALNYFPEQYEYLFKKYLPQYSCISVREESGVRLAKKYATCDVKMVCDPALLLTEKEWRTIAKGAHKYTTEPYILVYILAYSFDPFPEVDYIVDKVQNEMGLHVIYLDAGKRDYFKPNSQVVKDAGPKEFVDLFLNAEFVISSSFHGTVFSINFSKPFLSIISDNNPDTRITSLLKRVNCEKNGILYNEKCFDIPKMPSDGQEVNKFREMSIEYLKQCLN